MSALDTAARVLAWAEQPDGPIPQGDWRDPDALIRPGAAISESIGRLAALTAARLRLGTPPLGGASLGLDTALIAFALGVRKTPKLTLLLLQSAAQARTPLEWLARHGLMGPALVQLPAELADDGRLASPLTAVWDRPAKGQETAAFNLSHRLREDRHGRLALQWRLADPDCAPDVRRWRTSLLDRTRHEGEEGVAFILDVYEAQMLHHHGEVLAQIHAAEGVFIDVAAMQNEAKLTEALASAGWWGPLAALERTHGDALRARRHLGYDYRAGLKLYRLAQRLRGES